MVLFPFIFSFFFFCPFIFLDESFHLGESPRKPPSLLPPLFFNISPCFPSIVLVRKTDLIPLVLGPFCCPLVPFLGPTDMTRPRTRDQYFTFRARPASGQSRGPTRFTLPPGALALCCRHADGLMNGTDRSRHAARPRVRHPQVIHLHPRAPDGGGDAQGGQDPAGLGLADWQEEVKAVAVAAAVAVRV